MSNQTNKLTDGTEQRKIKLNTKYPYIQPAQILWLKDIFFFFFSLSFFVLDCTPGRNDRNKTDEWKFKEILPLNKKVKKRGKRKENVQFTYTHITK